MIFLSKLKAMQNLKTLRLTQRLLSILRTNKRNAKDDILYRCGELTIYLPHYHRLPEFQSNNRLYDKFLPILCSNIESDKIVIDIGANCGDTIAAAASANPDLFYIAIEADKYFFSYLMKNIKRINQTNPSVKFHAINSLVGKEINNVTLEGNGGTKKAVQNTSRSNKGSSLLQSNTLDDLIHNINIKAKDIALIKVDTDGYDYDVLNSGLGLVALGKPIIYFECQYETDWQKNCYIQTIKALGTLGYRSWTIFDNFGGIISHNETIDSVESLIEYIWIQNCKMTTRTIWYLDLLCYCDDKVSLVEEALSSYRSFVNDSEYIQI